MLKRVKQSRPYRKPLCPKCGDLGYVFAPGKLNGVTSVHAGGYHKVVCRKGCGASKRWLAEQGGKSVRGQP